MQIFLDDHCFISYFRDIKEKYSSIELMIELMEFILKADPLELFIPQDFFSLNIDGMTVAELVYGDNLDPSNRDLVARFEHIVRVAEQVPNDIKDGPTAAAGLKAAGRGGLITNSECEALVWWRAARMHKIFNQINLRSSVRKFFVTEKLPETELSNYSETMFESIYFHCPIEHVKHLGVKYVKSIGTIIKHFSYLNDLAISDFNDSRDDRERTTRAGKEGVNMTPESNSTRNNKNAMQQREVTILDVPISCEWHTKITPNHGRIHFYTRACQHEQFKKRIGNKLIIGIICKHLD